MLMERPVEGADGARHTRLTEYMIDVVRCADAGDLKCRMFLLREIGRGDRRKEAAQRNAKKAKSEELRKFEEQKAEENSTTMEPLTPEQEDAQLVKDVRPTPPSRRPTARPATASAQVSTDAPHSPAKPAAHAPAPRPPDDPSTYRRDAQGHLVTPEGRVLSPEEEERLANPYWPHVSPHLKKAPSAGAAAGPESPVPKSQAVDSEGDFGSEKFSRKNAEADADRESVH
jgi:hypothetical protein